MRVLTVGDGDLSYSLALARAFGEAIELTATTFVSEAELLETYGSVGRIISELKDRGAKVQHGVDATALEAADPPIGKQDHVIFNHPHLGLSDLNDEAAHAMRHGVLVSHFLQKLHLLLHSGRHLPLVLIREHAHG